MPSVVFVLEDGRSRHNAWHQRAAKQPSTRQRVCGNKDVLVRAMNLLHSLGDALHGTGAWLRCCRPMVSAWLLTPSCRRSLEAPGTGGRRESSCACAGVCSGAAHRSHDFGQRRARQHDACVVPSCGGCGEPCPIFWPHAPWRRNRCGDVAWLRCAAGRVWCSRQPCSLSGGTYGRRVLPPRHRPSRWMLQFDRSCECVCDRVYVWLRSCVPRLWWTRAPTPPRKAARCQHWCHWLMCCN